MYGFGQISSIPVRPGHGMSNQEEIKKIERRARALLTSKEIPPHKQEVVRTLMNNRQLKPGEKYQAIIELVQSCPDKKTVLYQDEGVKPEPARKKKTPPGELSSPGMDLKSAPTETSYYIDDLFRKYRALKLFRKRILVHRNNRIGIGFRRRLVPTKHLIKVMNYLAGVQSGITGRLVVLMMEIIKDPVVEDPLVFNHLRLARKWLAETPLIHLKYDVIKWMERAQFDRELKVWVSWFFSFLKLDGELRERLILEAETRLRSLEDFRKEELIDGEPDAYRREKEKRNLAKEKQVYEYMMILRSFLPIDAKQDCLLSKRLKEEFGVGSLTEIILAMEEALVFQRPVTREEIAAYYRIEAPFVNIVAWDYSEEYLVTVGKDAESLQKKKKESLRKVAEPFETLAKLLRHDDDGKNLLVKGVEDQWRYIDKKHHDPKTAYNENFISFLDALVQYFKNLYLPLLEGTTIVFRDNGREEFEGALFSFDYFEKHLVLFNKILDQMHYFRTNNPTLALSRNEMKKIMTGQTGKQADVSRFIRSIGDCFYLIGRELQAVYDQHRRWAAGRSVLTGTEPARDPLKNPIMDEASEWGRPIPFHDCVILEVENGTTLSKELTGKRVMEDSLYDGIFVRMNAFAYQVAYECMSERLTLDLEERKNLLKKIEDAQS
jgi:hypothetical protein